MGIISDKINGPKHKGDMGDHFNGSEKSARRRHCSKIIKTNLKTHISPLLNRPQGCQGCQKNRKVLRITIMIRFVANFQPKLKKNQKITKKRHISTIFVDFEGVYAIHSILAEN